MPDTCLKCIGTHNVSICALVWSVFVATQLFQQLFRLIKIQERTRVSLFVYYYGDKVILYRFDEVANIEVPIGMVHNESGDNAVGHGKFSERLWPILKTANANQTGV